jgi:hypothetical protein
VTFWQRSMRKQQNNVRRNLCLVARGLVKTANNISPSASYLPSAKATSI